MPGYRELFPRFQGRFDAESHFLHIVLPSVVRPGEPFALKAVMMDARGMPGEDFAGRIPLAASDPALRVPQAIEFGPNDFGMAAVDGLVAEAEGAYHITATPEGCPGAPPRSNPVVVRQSGPRLFWGDIHFHTVVGNCHPDTCKNPDFGYWYARHVALLDFASATDHLRGIGRDAANWEELKASAREHNRPGEFVTFLGFESSHDRGFGGDNNIHYDADEADHFWLDREDMSGISPRIGLNELWAWLDERGVPYVSIPHHTGRAHKYRDFELPFHNPARERVLEVFSMWGSSDARDDGFYLRRGKTDRRAYWQDALELGYRYGVIGSSDTHRTMPGTPFPVNPENYHYGGVGMNCQGLAAIWADELQRGRLFEALLSRRCYASTFFRPFIELTVCGHGMGEEVTADRAMRKAREIRATVACPWPADIVLLRNNREIARRKAEDGLTEWQLVDEEPLDAVCIDGAPRYPAPFAFYYLRIERLLGQTAWSSPVWMNLE